MKTLLSLPTISWSTSFVLWTQVRIDNILRNTNVNYIIKHHYYTLNLIIFLIAVNGYCLIDILFAGICILWDNIELINLRVNFLYEVSGFYSLYLLLLSGLLLLFVKAVQADQRTQKKQVRGLRNRIAADLHDSIGSSLSSIGLLGTLARNCTEDIDRFNYLIDQLVDETRQVSNALDDIVWSVGAQSELRVGLWTRMHRFAATLLESDGIIYQIQLPNELCVLHMSVEQQSDLYFFFKEVVNNIYKHSEASSVLITLTQHRKELQLTITDNGRGFDLNIQTERNGLRNLNRRAKSLNGRIMIQSALGLGTTIQLWFPFNYVSKMGH